MIFINGNQWNALTETIQHNANHLVMANQSNYFILAAIHAKSFLRKCR